METKMAKWHYIFLCVQWNSNIDIYVPEREKVHKSKYHQIGRQSTNIMIKQVRNGRRYRGNRDNVFPSPWMYIEIKANSYFFEGRFSAILWLRFIYFSSRECRGCRHDKTKHLRFEKCVVSSPFVHYCCS